MREMREEMEEGEAALASVLKAVDTIGNYSKIIVNIKTNLVTSNGDLLIL